jgi:nucleoside-diphosphate-sugar epimerase
MRVLVTGGTGYLGRNIVAALQRRGHEPTVFARHRADVGGAPVVTGDVRDRDAVLRAVRGMDAVCHTAALVSMWQRDPAEFDRVNVGGLETVLDVCATVGVPRLVYTSSFLALPPAGHARAIEANDYQRSKVRAREVARAAAARGAPVITMVPGVIYGPGAETEGNLVGRLIRDHIAGRLPGIIGADRLWSFSFVEDVADAHVSALEGGSVGDEYLVGGDNAPQIRVFEILRDLRGIRLPRRLPAFVASAAASFEEFRAPGRPPRLTRGTVRILSLDWSLNSVRSVEKLSYRLTPLDAGVRSILGRDF